MREGERFQVFPADEPVQVLPCGCVSIWDGEAFVPVGWCMANHAARYGAVVGGQITGVAS